MSRCKKVETKARRAPNSLSFDEACRLAECAGFVFARQSGSHRIYKHTAYPEIINLQPRKDGSAKGYQVQQILDAIDTLQK